MSSVHGLLVTFRRPAALAEMVAKVTDPSQGLASLTVVDNDPTTTAEELVGRFRSHLDVTYLPMAENVGPAGAVAHGTARILDSATNQDWIQVLDDDDPPPHDRALPALHELATELRRAGRKIGAVGMVGARFDRWTGRLHRPHDAELQGPVDVDYVAGNQLLLASVEAVRHAGSFDAELFFGYEELDFGLRLGAHGFAVVADGDEWREARRRAGRLGPHVGRSERKREDWRRYYAVRNHIVILRRYGRPGAALAATAGHLVARPVNDWRRREPVGALAQLTVRGVTDAWSGRLGRRVEPHDVGS